MNKIGIIAIAFMIMLSGIGIVSATSPLGVSDHVTVLEAVTAITITEPSVEFGDIIAGHSGSAIIHVNNIGGTNVNVNINPSVMAGTGLNTYQIPAGQITAPTLLLDSGVSGTQSVTLAVPSNAVVDTYSGTIDFVATPQ